MSTQDVQKRRDRLNILVLVLPGQWFGLMAVYWLRFLPATRPYHFEIPFPPVGVFVTCCAVSCLPFILPKGYFVPWGFERGSFYPWLGLRLFRLLATDGDLVNRAVRRIDPEYRVVRGRESLRKHIDGTYPNERWHSAFFIAGTLTAVHAIHTTQYVFGGLLVLTNVCFNLYPVLHQRYKRARLSRFMGRSNTAAAEPEINLQSK